MVVATSLLLSLNALPLASAQSTDGSGTPSAGADQWTSAPGESLASLAQALYPDDAAAREAFTLFVLRNNPAVFEALETDDPHTAELTPGTALITPTPGQVVMAAARLADTRGGGTPRAETDAREASAEAEPAQTVVLSAAEQHHRTQLIRGIEQSFSTQQALEERLQLLEEVQQTLHAQLETERILPITTAVPNERTRGFPEGTRHTPAQPPPESTSDAGNKWRIFLLLFAGGLLGMLLIRRLTTASTQAYATPSRSGLTKPRTATESAEESAPAIQHSLSPSPTTSKSEAESHEAAMELADIMDSFGRTHGAAETLADYVQAHPHQSVMPWLKLLTLYHKTGRQEEFESLANELNNTFNVRVITWANFGETHESEGNLEDFPHITRALVSQWRTRGCQIYIERLLRDNRKGSREGFPLGIIDDLLLLAGILEIEIGHYRPDD